MDKLTHYADIKVYTTKDGSLIRELIHPDVHHNQAQSLAEATVPPGCKTQLHRHGKTEELYHLTCGQGLMTLGDEQFTVKVGDSVCIPPGTAHCIQNTSSEPLVFLCCCSPAYSHQDTILLEQQ